jgi:exopolyphosphatase/guanosine-5'-triphosphate,3'-diphosphate pyrophosphatase
MLRRTTEKEKLRIPGMDPRRRDIAVPGGLLLAWILKRTGADAIVVGERGLREGLLLDTVARRGEVRMAASRDMRARSVDRLLRRGNAEVLHAAHVARLALELFDGLASVHGLDATAREYLEAGALLANVGLVVSHSKHHLHAYYVIRHSELAGLTDAEIEVIALIARYHRKSAPKSSHPPFAALTSDQQALVRTLAGILRVAIGLDRRHRGCVERVTVEVGPKRIQISVVPAPATGGDVALELYAANERKELLEDVLGRRVELIPAALTGARAAG